MCCADNIFSRIESHKCQVPTLHTIDSLCRTMEHQEGQFSLSLWHKTLSQTEGEKTYQLMLLIFRWVQNLPEFCTRLSLSLVSAFSFCQDSFPDVWHTVCHVVVALILSPRRALPWNRKKNTREKLLEDPGIRQLANVFLNCNFGRAEHLSSLISINIMCFRLSQFTHSCYPSNMKVTTSAVLWHELAVPRRNRNMLKRHTASCMFFPGINNLVPRFHPCY